MNGLLTDLYELTMAAGYFQSGKAGETATFELSFRRLPPNRNFVVAAGLAQAVDYLLNFRFSNEEIDHLRGLPQFRQAPAEFFEELGKLRFTGDVFAVPEGTPVFPGEPLLTVRAPLMEAQIPETYLLATVGFQSMIATKAARLAAAAGERDVVEFGTRRAHSAEAGVQAARAAYIGGCTGTSNTLAGFRYDIPVFGTAAHSWVQSFSSELEAFQALQRLLGPSTVQLVDTYDTLGGVRNAVSLGGPLWGVRLDSGNLVELAPQVRSILDGAGLKDVKIMVSGDLNEYKILELLKEHLPIDSFGVGTELATSADAPNLAVIYKLVELGLGEDRRYTAKFSEDKQTMPGAKQVFRYAEHDVVGRSDECRSCPEDDPRADALLRPVVLDGDLIAEIPEAKTARVFAAQSLRQLPTAVRSLFAIDPPYRVEYSEDLVALCERTRQTLGKSAG